MTGRAAGERIEVIAGRLASFVLAAVAALGVAAAAHGTRDAALETITVSNTNPNPVESATVLKPSHVYRITASGTVSDWCAATGCPRGDPAKAPQSNVGVDPLYCYAQWRCGTTPQLWRQLQVDGKGLDELAGRAGQIAYNPHHVYSVDVSCLSGRLSFVASDAVGSPSDNSGAFKVTIADRGAGPEAKWSIRAYANNVKVLPPLVGKFQLGKFHLRGSGTIGCGGAATGTLTDVDDLTSPHARLFITMKVVSGTLATNGAARTATLQVRNVDSDHANGECPIGITGTVVLNDDPTKLSNGKDSDYFTETWNGRCGHVHGTDNRDAGPRTSPPTGGPPNGGQWAIVRIR